FLPGIVGRQLAEFGVVVTIATLTSLFVSFTITPAMAGLWSLCSRWRAPRFIVAFDEGFARLRDWYHQRALPWGLKHPRTVVAIAAVTFVGALALVPLGLVGEEYIPNQDPGQIYVRFTFPVGTPVGTTTAAIHRVEQALLRIGDVDSMTRVAGAYAASFGGFVLQGNVGQIQLFLKANRQYSTSYWVPRIRAIARRAAPDGNPVAVPATGSTGGSTQPIDELVSDTSGGDPTKYALQVAQILEQTPGATNVNTSASTLSPQVDVQFDRDAARNLDVGIGTAATAVRAAFGGAVPTQVITSSGVMQVEVIYPLADQTNLGDVNAIPLRAGNGSIVSVGDVAHLTWAPTLPLITRENRLTVIHVNANVAANSSLSNVQTGFRKRLAAAHLPANIRVAPSAQGQQSRMAEVLSDIGNSMILSLILVYLLMVALYNSYLEPFVIMFAVPVAAVGALGSLWATHQTLNLFSLIGSILLIGLVTKNGILLVDYANTLRGRGLSKLDAIKESAFTRFRPIMMTTIAMVCGMFPLAIAFEPGSQVRQSLGIVVMGGLTSSLLLTLLLVPIMYVWLAPKEFVKPRRLDDEEKERSNVPAIRETHVPALRAE
ncbi:MAG: efflux RND transporter permease subunit, partial [Candidatus Eremiobacteraeota bacterium]|nr:efflux RND transporter permease subunit [Candidatus Eremiobacteraeota bacterium]